jgi:hypothetical protein
MRGRGKNRKFGGKIELKKGGITKHNVFYFLFFPPYYLVYAEALYKIIDIYMCNCRYLCPEE